MMAKKKAEILSVPVKFGSVSIDDGSASVPVTIDRGNLAPAKADDLFCGRRLKGKIAVGCANEDPEQTHMFDDMDYRVEAVFEVKGYGVKPKEIKATLNVLLKEVKVETLSHFAKHDGLMIVLESALLGEDKD